MKTRSVKSSQVSAFGRTEGGSDTATRSNGRRQGPSAPILRYAEAAPGPPLKTNVTGRGVSLGTTNAM